MSHEDFICDETFQVETGFIEQLDDEESFQIAMKYMKPCANCGEWVSKENIKDGLCTLCRESDDHASIRGSSAEAGENTRSLAELVERLEKFAR